MYQPMPMVRESAEELRALMKAETRPKTQQRLHALYLVASGQAKTRSAGASLLGIHRETVGDWLALYAEGGLERLLDLYVSPGKLSQVPPEVLQALRARLDEPEGFGSYGEIQSWLAE